MDKTGEGSGLEPSKTSNIVSLVDKKKQRSPGNEMRYAIIRNLDGEEINVIEHDYVAMITPPDVYGFYEKTVDEKNPILRGVVCISVVGSVGIVDTYEKKLIEGVDYEVTTDDE